jgi:hypothetical protein
MKLELALELALRMVSTWSNLGELRCLGKFAKIPNAAKHTQLSQVTQSHCVHCRIFNGKIVIE